MALYMLQGSYTTDAWAALCKNPADRRENLRALLQNVGGRLIELYYAFGEYDAIVLFEAPDNTAAVSAVLAAISPGHVKANKTTVLMTVEETMTAMRRAGGISYQGPSSAT